MSTKMHHPMRIGSLFTGYGGLDQAAEAFYGATTAWVSDIDPGANRILNHRYPDIPNLGDITTIDWAAVEPVDIITGGFPCQDLSHAGKRAGLHDGTRSGLWTHMALAVETIRPKYVVIENVRGLLSATATSDLEQCPWCMGAAADGEPALRALGCVLGDLADIGGYDVRWTGLRAADVGAPHGRFRIFVVATRNAADEQQERAVGVGDRGRRPEAQVGNTGGDSASGCVATDARRLRARRVAAPSEAGGGGSLDHVAGRGGAHSVADTEGDGRDERRPEPTRQLRRPDAPLSSSPPPTDAGGERHGGRENPGGLGRLDSEDAGSPRERQRAREVAGNRSATTPTDTSGSRRPSQPCVPDEGGPLVGAEFGASVGDGSGDPAAGVRQLGRSTGVEWGAYEPAIRRWERVLGRVAPPPTETSPKGAQRLSPRFVEWMMGLPAGWVTDVPGLNRNAQLKALGNGVMPQQAFAAQQQIHAQTQAAA